MNGVAGERWPPASGRREVGVGLGRTPPNRSKSVMSWRSFRHAAVLVVAMALTAEAQQRLTSPKDFLGHEVGGFRLERHRT